MAQVTGEVQETPMLSAKHPLYSCSSLLPSILCKSYSSLTSHHTGRTFFLQPECSQTSIPLLGTCFPEFLSISVHLSKPTNNPSLQMCLSPSSFPISSLPHACLSASRMPHQRASWALCNALLFLKLLWKTVLG